MKIPTIISILVILSFTSCTKETLTEVIDPNEAKLIGSWKHLNSRSWGSLGDGMDFISDYYTTDTVLIEFKKGNFKLLNDQLTFEDRVFTVEFRADTLLMSQPQYVESYIRWNK